MYVHTDRSRPEGGRQLEPLVPPGAGFIGTHPGQTLFGGGFRARWATWPRAPQTASIDQALFAGSNFGVNILLARWLPPEQYGAVALTSARPGLLPGRVRGRGRAVRPGRHTPGAAGPGRRRWPARGGAAPPHRDGRCCAGRPGRARRAGRGDVQGGRRAGQEHGKADRVGLLSRSSIASCPTIVVTKEFHH